VYDHYKCSDVGPLHKGMHFAVAQHTEVDMRLSALCAAVCVATQSILGHMPIDVF
jgi:hypothetical protein